MSAPRQLLTLDVSRRNASRHVVYLGEGDVNGTTLVITVTEGGTPFDCSGFVPYLMIPMRDGTVYRSDGVSAGNSVTITVDESGLGNVSGKLPGAYVSLEANDGTITSTQRFDVCVIASSRDSVMPDTFVTDMEALSARVAALEAAVGIATDSHSDDFGDDGGNDTGQDTDTEGDPTEEPPTGGDDSGDGPEDLTGGE